MSGIFKKTLALFLAVGPGLFCVGYTIGTGSVTSMIVAGSKYGTRLIWVVALSCLFSAVLMEAYGRFALVTGETSLHAFRTRFGRPFALLVMIMVVAGQWCCLSGLVGLTSQALCLSVDMVSPKLAQATPFGTMYIGPLVAAILVLLAVYTLFWFGNYSRLETALAAMVTLLALSFVLSLLFVAPSFKQFLAGFIPSIPANDGAPSAQHGAMLVAAMVGTTLAAPTFVVRPILVLSKGWTVADLGKQRRDVAVSGLVMFMINAAIICCATGAIYNAGGKQISNVLDMVETLRPLAGNFAAILFIVGLVSAGLSSILPIAMIAGFLLGDYRNGQIQVNSAVFRVLTAVACLFGLVVPILGANPVAAQVATQTSQVFVLPLVIVGIFILVNRRSVMKEHAAGLPLNLGLLASLGFSLVISYQALVGLVALLSSR